MISPVGAELSYQSELEYLHSLPTAKQKKYLYFLQMTLKEHDVKYEKREVYSRGEYAAEINRLITLCDENGIPVRSNRKQFDRVLVVGSEGFKGRDKVVERLIPPDECKQKV